jgi:hypothetical protein
MVENNKAECKCNTMCLDEGPLAESLSTSKVVYFLEEDPYIEEPPKGCWHYFTKCLCGEFILFCSILK